VQPPTGYKILAGKHFSKEPYSIESIRIEDALPVMEWRNAQLDALRQKDLLTSASQQLYFQKVVSPQFRLLRPEQVLLRLTFERKLIGYGGLVHIDWSDRRAEVSFLLETERAKNIDQYEADFVNFLTLLKQLSFDHLDFHKITTESYSHRKKHVEIIEKCGFTRDGVLREQVRVSGNWVDAIMCSCLQSEYQSEEIS